MSHRSTMVVDQNDAHRLKAAGVEFAYLHDHEVPGGSHRIVTVPELILACVLALWLLGVLFGLFVFLVVFLTIVPFSHSSISC
jgi:hypothetical protein